jgi:hypothetical protein
LTNYIVKVKTSSSTFVQITCDEDTATLLSGRICTFPISSLKTTPFNLAWGVEVVAKLTAINVYGSSTVSAESQSGAIILTVPDAPLNLANDAELTTGSQIALTWNQGVENGGTPVIDFSLAYKFGSEPYTLFAEAITQ